jgi:hypothetical protein
MTRASDASIDAAAEDVRILLKDFDSPKDAGAAFTLAHYKMVAAAFPPEDRQQAIESVEAHAKTVIELLNDGWH